jgi:cytochrome oxidase Cu insertion factor (SCO1/SenC/PrrC family)
VQRVAVQPRTNRGSSLLMGVTVKFVRIFVGAMALATASLAFAEAPAPRVLGPGDKAPDFTLLSDDWKEVKLSDFRGKKNVVLVFYVLAFTDT